MLGSMRRTPIILLLLLAVPAAAGEAGGDAAAIVTRAIAVACEAGGLDASGLAARLSASELIAERRLRRGAAEVGWRRVLGLAGGGRHGQQQEQDDKVSAHGAKHDARGRTPPGATLYMGRGVR